MPFLNIKTNYKLMSSKFNEDQFKSNPNDNSTVEEINSQQQQQLHQQEEQEHEKLRDERKAAKEERKQQKKQATGNNNVSTIEQKSGQELYTRDAKGNLVKGKVVQAANNSGTIVVPVEGVTNTNKNQSKEDALREEIKAYNKARYDRGFTIAPIADENTSLVAEGGADKESKTDEDDPLYENRVQGARKFEEEWATLQASEKLKEEKKGLLTKQ